MAEGRRCLACGADLVGPFLPQIDLAQPFPADVEVVTRSWICPDCGLVHWYAEEREPDAPGAVVPQPGSSGYERRSEIARMLRRVRRF